MDTYLRPLNFVFSLVTTFLHYFNFTFKICYLSICIENNVIGMMNYGLQCSCLLLSGFSILKKYITIMQKDIRKSCIWDVMHGGINI